METKRPIYGYSSRHFDAVASGQVLAQGAILINYVDQNYLFRAIELALQEVGQYKAGAPPPAQNASEELRAILADEGNALSLANQYFLDPNNNPDIAQALKSSRWQQITEVSQREVVPNPFDAFGGLDLKVTFGDREAYNFYGGLTNMIIRDVHFTGRGMQVGVSEEVLMEEHPFFARNIEHVIDRRTIQYEASPDGDVTTTIQ